jgi:xanthine dehydrogenase iron-sulfur cluster and FAD-binding subunit A
MDSSAAEPHRFHSGKDVRMNPTIRINGAQAAVPADPRVSLLDFLREHLHLTGTKKGCNQGACGACTVLVDGEQRILSCLALAIQYQGRDICIRCNKLSSNTMVSNAAIARPVRSVRRSAWRPSSSAACPAT